MRLIQLISPRRIRRRIYQKLCCREWILISTCVFAYCTFVLWTTDGFQSRHQHINGPIIGGRCLESLSRTKSSQVRRRTAHNVITVTEREPGYPPMNCTSWFKESFEENLNILKNYPRGDADKYLWKIGGNKSHPDEMLTSFPVIVTAASSGFYRRSLSLFKSIYEFLLPKYKKIKIIYYDLGLDPKEYRELITHCKCEVRRFPFEEFPSHVHLLWTYTWKPIIIQQVLMEYGFVWWADGSVRFTTGNLDDALEYSRKNSILAFTYGPELAIAAHTDTRTMKYLGEDPCKFRYFGENEAGFLLFHYDEISRILLNAWVACALNEQCMCPDGTEYKRMCRREIKDGICHRYDQSVFSILFRRLYHEQNDYPLVKTPLNIHEVRRKNSLKHFPVIND